MVADKILRTELQRVGVIRQWGVDPIVEMPDAAGRVYIVYESERFMAISGLRTLSTDLLKQDDEATAQLVRILSHVALGTEVTAEDAELLKRLLAWETENQMKREIRSEREE